MNWPGSVAFDGAAAVRCGMSYIELMLKDHTIVHGYGDDGAELTERVEVETATRKLVSVDRILSVTDNTILMSSPFGRVVYWEYADGYDSVKKRLMS